MSDHFTKMACLLVQDGKYIPLNALFEKEIAFPNDRVSKTGLSPVHYTS